MHSHPVIQLSQVSSAVQTIQKRGGLEFREILPAKQVAAAVANTLSGFRSRIFSPSDHVICVYASSSEQRQITA